MKPAPFEYHAPETVEEVVGLLGEHGDEAKIIAGGQSLVPMLSMRLARPTQLVDVNGVAELAGIEASDGVVSFGATTRQRAAERSALVAERIPVMAEALPLIGHEAIRNRGTIGGSVVHADASAELPAVMVLTEATMVATSRRGERRVDAGSFFDGHYMTALEDDECLVGLEVPVAAADTGWAFEEVARRHGDFALVGVAAMVELANASTVAAARLCLMGVSEVPLRVSAVEADLVGAEVGEETFAAAAAAAVADLAPASDVHGSGEFRRHLAQVTVHKALARAAGRAGGTPT